MRKFKRGDRMEKRMCRTCKKDYPLNEEYFYRTRTNSDKLTFYNECKVCSNDRRKYNYALTKAKKIYEEETKWLKELEDKIFICKYCEREKRLPEMRVMSDVKRVSPVCMDCYRPKRREYNDMFKANNFVRVLKEKEEDVTKND